jgi:hypothetical protein
LTSQKQLDENDFGLNLHFVLKSEGKATPKATPAGRVPPDALLFSTPKK